MTTTRSPGPAGAQWFDRSLLTDASRCPACAAPLAGPGCDVCGLPLGGPAAAALWESSRRAAALLDRRESLIVTLRRSGVAPTAPARPVAASPAPSLPSTAPVHASGGFVPPVHAAAQPSAPWSPPSSAPSSVPVAAAVARPAPAGQAVSRPVGTARQSWPLQNVLLGLGALLLAGASIVFLAFTWGEMPLPLRAAVIAVVTAAVFGSASVAARKGLQSSADSIAALGSLLVLLDAWALHATGLVPRPDGATFAAAAALGSALVLVAIGSLLRLDVPRASGCLLLPAAPLLLSLDATSPTAAAFLVLVATASCGVQLTRFCERRVAPALRTLAVVLVVVAVLTSISVLLVDGALAAAGILLLAALVSAAWALLLPAPGHAWPVLAGVTQALAVLCAALALTDVSGAPTLWLAPLGGLLGAASVVLTVRRLPALTQATTTAAWSTFYAASAAPVLAVVAFLVVTLTTGVPVADLDVLGAALVGLVVALAGSFGRESLRGPLTGRAPAPVGFPRPGDPWAAPSQAGRPSAGLFAPAPFLAGLLLVGACLLAPWIALTVALWLVVPLAVVLVAGARPSAAWRTAARATCLTAVASAITLSAVLGAGVADPAVTAREGRLLLAASLLVGMATLLVARSWVAQPQGPGRQDEQGRAGLLLGALVVGAAGTGTALAATTTQDLAASPGSTLPLLLLALGLVLWTDRTDRTRPGATATGPEPARRVVTAADVRATLAAAATVVAVALVAAAAAPGGWLVPGLASDAPAAWVSALVVASTALASVLAGLLALGGRRTVRSAVPPGALVACAAAAPVLAVLAALAVRPLVVGHPVGWELVAIVVVAFFPVLAAVRTATPPVRRAMETSAVTLAVISVLLVAARRPSDDLTVGLALCAAATAAWAFMPRRARAGWVALALSVAASWNALATGDVALVEAYTAPGAAVLAAVGAWRASRGATSGRHQLLAGTALLLLPTALLAPPSAPWRSLAVLGALVVLASGTVLAGPRRQAGTAPSAGSALSPDPSRSSPSMAPSLAASLLALGLTAAVVGAGGRAVALAAAWSTTHGDAGTLVANARSATATADAERLLSGATAHVGAWVVVGALFVGALCWLLGRAWSWTPAAGPRTWGAALTALVTTAPVAVLVAGGALGTGATTALVLALLGLWGATALLGTPPGLPRVTTRTDFLRRALPPLAAAYVVALGLGPRTDAPLDVLLTVVGVVAAVVAVRAAVLETRVPTWSTAGYGVLASLAPVTVAMLVDPEPWRVVAGVLGAAGWLLAGLRLRWQAPVGIGAAALVLQVVVLAGPPALASLAGVPGWVVLAVTGLVLLGLGLTYERQITAARGTLRRFAELR